MAGYLRWADVDPRQRPALDLARVAAVVLPHVAAARTARGPRNREALVETIERELLIEFGSWIGGWTWAANESGGGGPVHGWCCAEHSVFPGPRTDLPADDDPVTSTTNRVVGAVEDWSRCLDEIAALFAELRGEAPLPGPRGNAPALELAIERAASRILPYVVDRTHAEDAWYGTFAKLLAWYVEPAGHDRDLVLGAIEKTTNGKFGSWMEPSEEVARETCVELGRAIARASDGPTRDATAAWLEARPGTFMHLQHLVPAPVRADGHQRYIDRVDHARDPERAERMSAALVLCRDSAKRGMRLTFDQMCEWQAAVLGVSRVAFRTATAYAKNGREIYPWVPTSQQRFEAALADAAGAHRVSIRAARVYLDVCFHHPFADGNARAARLALDHVLTSAGFALHAADPVFVVSRSADDRHVAWGLARVLERMIGPLAF